MRNYLNSEQSLQDTFLGEIEAAIIFAGDGNILNPTYEIKHLKVQANGNLSEDGQLIVDSRKTKGIRVFKDFNDLSCYYIFPNHLANQKQSSVIASFNEQKRIWSSPYYVTDQWHNIKAFVKKAYYEKKLICIVLRTF